MTFRINVDSHQKKQRFIVTISIDLQIDWAIFVTGRNSHHYCYDVSYQCWFASEEAKIYCNNFNSSNAVVCSHLIRAYTVWLAIMNAVELERHGCMFVCLFVCFLYWCCIMIAKNIDKRLANRISYQIWYKWYLKGKSDRGSKSAKGGPYPLEDFDQGGSKSAVISAYSFPVKAIVVRVIGHTWKTDHIVPWQVLINPKQSTYYCTIFGGRKTKLFRKIGQNTRLL